MNSSANLSGRPRQDSCPSIPFSLVALLGAAMFLNYADRGSLSIVAPVLKNQLAITNSEMGLLLSSFFWSYALAQPAAGWIAQRYPPRSVLALAAGLWSVATFCCGFGGGIVALFLLRLLLGLAESAIFPTTARIFAELAPDRQRGRCNAAMSVGTAVGPSVGVALGAMILIAFGWRAVFFGLGILSLLWLGPWLLRSDLPVSTARADAARPVPYREILRQRALWGACIAQLCWAFPFYLVLTWLPLYLVNSEHLSLSRMALVTAGLYALQALGAVASGWGSDALIERGGSAPRVRKAFVVAGMGGTAILFGLAALSTGPWSTALVVASGFAVGFAYTMVFTIGQTLAGPRAAGRWMGLQNMAGNLSGIAAPVATGVAVDWTGSFDGAFMIASAVSVIGTLSWLFIVRHASSLRWSEDETGA